MADLYLRRNRQTMWRRVFGAVSIVFLVSHEAARAQRNQPAGPDLQGTWNAATMTPLQRPPEFKDRAAFTPEEAAEYLRTAADRLRKRLPTEADRLTQADVDDTYVETEAMPLDRLRTSLIVDPPNGILPPLLPAAQARLAARPKRSFDDPEALNLAERCLLGNFAPGGSMASPPLLPSPVIPAFYQIVQTDAHVLIFAEWVHDARVIRMNATHLPSTIRKWLGDSIGRWEGDTLVVDTTNFTEHTRFRGASENLHIVERFTRADARTLRYQFTVEDPTTWARAWTAEYSWPATNEKIYEYACHEGNYAMENILRGARLKEADEAKKR